MIARHLLNHLEDYRPFRFSHYFNTGFKLFSENVGSFVAYSFLSFAICLAVGNIPVIGNFVVDIFLWPSFVAGFYLVANHIKNVESFEFEHHFHGFKYFFQLSLMIFLATLILKIALLPFYFAHFGLANWSWNFMHIYDALSFFNMIDNYPNFYSWKLIFLLPSLYFFIAYGWACQFVIFFKMPIWDAMETSRKMITERWFLFLLFYAVQFLVGFGGLIGLIIGFFVTLPAVMCVDYAAFEDLTQLSKFKERIKFDMEN